MFVKELELPVLQFQKYNHYTDPATKTRLHAEKYYVTDW